MRTILEKKKRKQMDGMKSNYSQANLPSKEDRAIPNAWTAHNGYLKSHVKISKFERKILFLTLS